MLKPFVLTACMVLSVATVTSAQDRSERRVPQPPRPNVKNLNVDPVILRAILTNQAAMMAKYCQRQSFDSQMVKPVDPKFHSDMPLMTPKPQSPRALTCGR